jgi:hypothetical protein
MDRHSTMRRWKRADQKEFQHVQQEVNDDAMSSGKLTILAHSVTIHFKFIA